MPELPEVETIKEGLNKTIINLEISDIEIKDYNKNIKETIKGLQIAETQLKMHEDTLKLLSISRNYLANQLREKLNKMY